MEMLNIFFCIILIGCSVLARAQDQSGFISLDCGISSASTYNDAITGIKYISDATFIDSGLSKSISPQFQTNTISQQFYSVRSFPEGVRNCYTLKPSQGKNNKYLIRASFMYGNYDDQNKPPEFDLHLGVNSWDSVKIDNESSIVIKEIMHLSPSDTISVCLINKGTGIPFISTLELRHFRTSTYPTPFEAVVLYRRVDVGTLTNQFIRYKDDAYDRIWKPQNFPNSKVINTTLAIDARDNNGYNPGSAVMGTALTPINASKPLGFYWEPTDSTARYFVFMHFAEVEELKPNEIREFNVTQNGEFLYGPVEPEYLYTNTLSTTVPVSGDYIEFWLERTNRSTLPPILNGLEIFMVKDFSESRSDAKEVDAIMDIKSTYGVKRNWQGDPCAPKAYSWDGLNCSFIQGSDPPRIISLNLSSNGLTGEIAASISNLAMLQHLDLSNNSLTGKVPEFLSQMPFLTVLNLKGNKLSGSLPVKLLERSNNGSLSLSVEENPDLCLSAACQKKEKQKKNFVAPLAASAGIIFVILAAVAVFLIHKRRKREVVTKVNVEDENQVGKNLMESKNRQFTYAEVKLLSRVHHGNLTNLVGYCYEDGHMGLIYEYMANGNLKQLLSGRNTYTVSWEERLRIATDAAQGLEYLHYGCNPPIVHRDVKSENILLNDKLQAKIADFGLSRIFSVEGGGHVSTAVAGTPGYLDPEYQINNWLNEKSDVYSFGVVLLEIVTRRPVVTKSFDEAIHISHWVSSLLANGEIKRIVDPSLGEDFEINSAWKIVELALACTSRNSSERPTMSEVVVELKECLKKEVARKRGGHGTRSRAPREGMSSINIETDSFPRPR
ncbi:hypothetical protein COLO4_30550 [Corchorus olitorius]|uniref:Protein kinase domain-containing protein n=1 Tax=Corchorus olitorius TaxID=93759 RepID=A0A1R3H805_9ROSI|nr:hypothetical protein COLO4_30550 [Corchorus olitorius]